MILVDTSVWIQHFRVGLDALAKAINADFVAIHPIVLGELAVGNLSKRQQTLAELNKLPCTKMASASECMAFIENRKIYGRGLGWNDVQLLVAARLSGSPLWTLDARLAKVATELGAGYQAP